MIMNKERVDQLLELLKEDPKDVFCRYALALEYATEPSFLNSAIKELEKLRKSDEDYLPIYFQLGLLYQKLVMTDEAKRAVSDGLKLAKLQGNTHAYYELEFLMDDLE